MSCDPDAANNVLSPFNHGHFTQNLALTGLVKMVDDVNAPGRTDGTGSLLIQYSLGFFHQPAQPRGE